MVRSSISSTDSSLENLTIIHDFNLKLFTLISCIFCISTTTLSIIGSLLFDRLLTFNYGSNVVEEITMNHIMIYILLGIISIFNMGILSMISINNDRMLTKLIYSLSDNDNLKKKSKIMDFKDWNFILEILSISFPSKVSILSLRSEKISFSVNS